MNERQRPANLMEKWMARTQRQGHTSHTHKQAIALDTNQMAEQTRAHHTQLDDRHLSQPAQRLTVPHDQLRLERKADTRETMSLMTRRQFKTSHTRAPRMVGENDMTSLYARAISAVSFSSSLTSSARQGVTGDAGGMVVLQPGQIASCP